MRFLRDNGLTLAFLAVFAFSLVGMLICGHAVYNGDRADHGMVAIGLSEFLFTGMFLSALFENWESEFLQMAAFVIFTAYLYQRGSAESRDPDKPHRPGDEMAPGRGSRTAIWLYSHSLGLALLALFAISLALHWQFSVKHANAEALQHGRPVISALAHLGEPMFWFESLQNWQSEFLSTAVLVVLSIFLRFKASPESKPVTAGDDETGP